MASIVITEGPRAGERIEVDKDLTLGRAGAEVIIEDSEVSRRHAVFRPVADGLEIEDLGSTNGTWVNQARITDVTKLRNGDIVRVGTTSITVEVVVIPDAAALTVPAQAAVAPPTEQVAARSAPPATAVPAAAAQPAAAAATPTAPPVAAAPPAAAPPAAAAAALVAAPSSPPAFGGSRRRRRSVASRQLFPIVFCFVAIVATAAALVLYFAFR